MKKKIAEVRELLGDSRSIKDSEIRETLWYYYFDVEQTLSWLLGKLFSRRFIHLLDQYSGAGTVKPEEPKDPHYKLNSQKGKSSLPCTFCPFPLQFLG
jgi:HBS1 N-terminus